MIGLLLREALDRLCVRLNMYLVASVVIVVAAGGGGRHPQRHWHPPRRRTLQCVRRDCG